MVFVPQTQEEKPKLMIGFNRNQVKAKYPNKPPTVDVRKTLELAKPNEKNRDKVPATIKREMRRQRAKNRRVKREQSAFVSAQAVNLAKNNGLVLTPHGKKLYTLESPTGWLLSIRPGSRGLDYEPTRKGPLFEVPDDWNLLDVVAELIRIAEKQDGTSTVKDKS